MTAQSNVSATTDQSPVLPASAPALNTESERALTTSAVSHTREDPTPVKNDRGAADLVKLRSDIKANKADILKCDETIDICQGAMDDFTGGTGSEEDDQNYQDIAQVFMKTIRVEKAKKAELVQTLKGKQLALQRLEAGSPNE